MTPLEAAEFLYNLIENKTQCFHREMVGAQQAIAVLRQVLKEQAGKDALAKAKREEQQAKQAQFLKGDKATPQPADPKQETKNADPKPKHQHGKRAKGTRRR